MGRPRTAVGAHGEIRVIGYTDASRNEKVAEGQRAAVYVARTRYRDTDGRNRLVEASAATKARATTALKQKLTERQRIVSNGSMRSNMSVGRAADFWLTTLEGQELAEGTRRLYQGNVRRYVHGSSIEHLTLSEVNNVATLEKWLKTIADSSGNGAAKGARSVLGNTLSLAVRYGVLNHSALREAKTPKASAKKKAERDPDRVFTPEELTHLLEVAETHATARNHDLTDLFHFLAGTGVRINEALTMRWSDLDLAKGRVHIRGTKTEFSDRHLYLSERLVVRLTERHQRLTESGQQEPHGSHVVFHSPGTNDRTKPRNRDNLLKRLRVVFDAAGATWATSHTFRHGVITRIVEAGHDIGLAADQAGHSDLRTTQAYIGRKRDTRVLAGVL